MMKRDNYKEFPKMGMAASSANLLFFTNRLNAIKHKETILSNDRMALTRDMQKLTREYKDAINQKSIKWTTNGGITYTDMSYANLMRPSILNGNTPQVITDPAGKVVIDSKYKRFAEMISVDGTPGGDWESARALVLSELLGIDETDMEEYSDLEMAALENKYIYDHMDLPDDDPDKIEAKRVLDESVDEWNQLTLYSEESEIAYYDKLFSAIADCGWVYNSEVSDTDYLNQMFQNGIYNITTVERMPNERGEYEYNYDVQLASNCTNTVMVNDSVQNSLKTSEYEYKKSVIQDKETLIDQQMKKYQTEAESINTMLESIKGVMNDNIETNFKIFG